MPPRRAKKQPSEDKYSFYPGKCEPVVDDLPPAEELLRIERLLKHLMAMKELSEEERLKFPDLLAHVTRSDLLERCSKSAEAAVTLGCVIADILRLFLPQTPPMEPEKATEVLLFLVSALKALDVGGPLFEQANYLLEDIVTYESWRLGSLSENEEGSLKILKKLILVSLNLFSVRDEVVLGKPPDVDIDAATVQRLLLRLIQDQIAAISQVANEVLDALFYFTIEPQKSKSPISYRMAAEIIKQSYTSIEPWCMPFLSQAIVTQEMPQCEMTGLAQLDSIVFSLYEIVPDMILSVLPQLEQALTAGNTTYRLNATKLLGDIFKLPDVDAADKVPQLWSVYLERSKDVDKAVRKQCTDTLPAIFLEHQSVRGEISDALSRRCNDEVEEVRLSAVRGIFIILKTRADLATDTMLRQVRNHVHPMEKKQSVRHECLIELSKIFNSTYSSSSTCTASVKATIADTIGGVFRYINLSAKDDRIALEKQFVLNIFAYKLPVKERVQMLLDLFLNLRDDASIKTFTTLLQIQARRMRVIRVMWEAVKAASNNNAAESSGFEKEAADERESENLKQEWDNMLRQLADTEMEPALLASGMRKFAAFIEKEPQVFHALGEILKVDYQCEQVEKQMLEIRKLLTSPDTEMDEQEMRLVRSFLERSVPLQFDNKVAIQLSNDIDVLIREAICGKHTALANRKSYLSVWKIMAEHYPQCFLHKDVARVVWNLLENDESVVKEHALSIIILTSRVRNSQQRLKEMFPEYHINLIISIAKEGPPKSAKYAARCLCRLLGKNRTSEVFKEMKETLISHVDASDPLCETALQTLTVMLHAFPKDYAVQIRDMIGNRLYERVIRAETSGDRGADDVEDQSDVVEVTKPKEIRPQIMALKFLYRYHRTLQTEKDSTLRKTVSLYVSILNTRGSSLSEHITDEHTDILMFYAANYLLKMSQYAVYHKAVVTPEVISSLSLIIYDVSGTFRNLFANKFQPLLQKTLLPVEFMSLYAFAPLVKGDNEYVNSMTSSLRSTLATRKRLQAKSQSAKPSDSSEYAIAYAINAFALVPDWKEPEDLDELKKFKKCLWTVIGAINEKRDTCCSLDLLKQILEAVKASDCDWCPQDYSKQQRSDVNMKMWILADTGLSLLFNKTKMTDTKNRREKILLAPKFFKPSTSKNLTNKSFAPQAILKDETEEFEASTSATKLQSVSPIAGINGSEGHSRFLSHLVSPEPLDESSASKKRRSLKKKKNGSLSNSVDVDEAGPSKRIKKEKAEPTKPKSAPKRAKKIKVEKPEPAPHTRSTRSRGAVIQEEVEEIRPKRGAKRGAVVKKAESDEESGSDEEKPPVKAARKVKVEESCEEEVKPKRGSRRAPVKPKEEPEPDVEVNETPKKSKRRGGAKAIKSEESDHEGQQSTSNADEAAGLRSSGRVRRQRPIFDCSPIMSPVKEKPMAKGQRNDLETRFASISPIAGTSTLASKLKVGPVSSTPAVKKGRAKPVEKAAALPTRQSSRRKK